MKPIRIGVVGVGRWGRNLVRNVDQAEFLELAAVCDLDADRLNDVPCCRRTSDPEVLLNDPTLEAVVIATPPDTHVALAEAALRAGKHVLCEKPLATDADDCRSLARIAEDSGLTLMVDCTPAYLHEIEAAGRTIPWDEVTGIRCRRFSRQPPRHDVDVLWDLAPHDLTIVDLWLGGSMPSEWTLRSTPEGVQLASVAPERPLIRLDIGYGTAEREIVVATSGSSWSFTQQQTYPEPLQTVVSRFAMSVQTGHRPCTDASQAIRIAEILAGVTLCSR